MDAFTVVIPRVRRGEWEVLGVQSQICHFLPLVEKVKKAGNVASALTAVSTAAIPVVLIGLPAIRHIQT
jgi:hypothetical protein